MAGPQGIRDATWRALHHSRERWCTLGGVCRRAQPGLPQTLHHGSQLGWHGGGPLVAQEPPAPNVLRTAIVTWCFCHEAFRAADFPSRTVYCGGRQKSIRWSGTLKVGNPASFVQHGTATCRLWAETRVTAEDEETVHLFAQYENIPQIHSCLLHVFRTIPKGIMHVNLMF